MAGRIRYNKKTVAVIVVVLILLLHVIISQYRHHYAADPDDESVFGSCETCITRHPRQNTCHECFKNDYKVINDNDHSLCTANEKLDLLVVVATHPTHVDTRNAIRKTWGSFENSYANMSFRVLFVMGQAQNDTSINKVVGEEAKAKQDLVQYEFDEAFHNNTVKTILGLRWTIENCKTANHLLKVNDDVFVNIANLADIIREKDLTTSIAGHAMPKDRSPIRKRNSKFYIPYSYYPEPYYPAFISDEAYIMSFETAASIIKLAPDTPYFPLEGLYLSFLIHKLEVKIESIDGFNNHNVFRNAIYYCSCLITSTGLGPNEFTSIWDGMQYQQCQKNRAGAKSGYSCQFWYSLHTAWVLGKFILFWFLIINTPISILLHFLAYRGIFINNFHQELWAPLHGEPRVHILESLRKANQPVLMKNV